MAMNLIVDAHLDLSWSALSWNREMTESVQQMRQREAQMTDDDARGHATVSLEAMRQGRVGICLATLLARAKPDVRPASGYRRDDLDFGSQTIAHATACGQLAYYHLLERQGLLCMIRDAATLDRIAQRWIDGDTDAPFGYVLSMEGCDPIVEPDHAAWWWDQGLRTACLAHYGQSFYAMGTGGDGPLTDKGRKLLGAFDQLGMLLDLVHTADTAFDQAVDIFGGPVFASHGNTRALNPADRQLTDRQIQQIVERGGVIGVVLDNWQITPDWPKESGGDRQKVGLHTVADHVDHICQLVGNCQHVGIGSDLDGGFGAEQSPHDLDTIADMQKFAPILSARGYSDDDITAFMYGNWLRFLGEKLPQ